MQQQSRSKLYLEEDDVSLKTLKPMQVHTVGSNGGRGDPDRLTTKRNSHGESAQEN